MEVQQEANAEKDDAVSCDDDAIELAVKVAAKDVKLEEQKHQ